MKNQTQHEIPEEIILQALNLSSNNIVIADINANIIWANQHTFDFTGYSQEELIGQNCRIFRHPENDDNLYEDMWKTIKIEKKAWKGKIKNRKKDKSSYIEFLTITPILDENGEIEFFIGIQIDITEIETIKDTIKEKIEVIHKEIKKNMLQNPID